jgi:hypothetical protein
MSEASRSCELPASCAEIHSRIEAASSATVMPSVCSGQLGSDHPVFRLQHRNQDEDDRHDDRDGCDHDQRGSNRARQLPALEACYGRCERVGENGRRDERGERTTQQIDDR